jgi:hypothetical protein
VVIEGADRAPWEFEFVIPKGEDPAHVPTEQDRQGIWWTWCKAQALQSSDWSGTVQGLYVQDDAIMLGQMKPEQRKRAGDERSLGIPLLPRDAAPLAKFRIARVRIGGWGSHDGKFTTAIVEATGGTRTLRFAMRFGYPISPETGWHFTATPVEIE